jgi:hypothetical protein
VLPVDEGWFGHRLEEAGRLSGVAFSCVTVLAVFRVCAFSEASGVVTSKSTAATLLNALTELMASLKTCDVFSLAVSSPTSSHVPLSIFLRNLIEEVDKTTRYSRDLILEVGATNKAIQSYLPGGLESRMASTSSRDICDFPFFVAE